MATERLDAIHTEDYVELMFHWHRYLSVKDLVRNKTVLDIACGQGYGSNILSETATRVFGIDIDEESIEQAKRNYLKDNLLFSSGDAINLLLENDSVDVVVSFETIEHMPEENQIAFLKEIKRVLRPGGKLVMSTPDKHRTDLFNAHNPYHIKEFYFEEYEQFLKSHFLYAEFYYQEINMSSLIWNREKRIPNYASRQIEISNSGVKQAESGTVLHLYVLALCSDEQIDIALDSLCIDINRTPLERLYHQIESMQRNEPETDSSQLIRYLNEDLSKIKMLHEELTQKYDQLVLEQDVYRQRNEYLLNDIDLLKKRVSKQVEERDNLKFQLTDLKEDKRMLKTQLEQMWGLVNEHKKAEEHFKAELNYIYNMNTWKLLKVYHYIMDRTFIGWILKWPRKAASALLGRRNK